VKVVVLFLVSSILLFPLTSMAATTINQIDYATYNTAFNITSHVDEPYGIYYVQSLNSIAVANDGNNTISVYNSSTGSFLLSVRTGIMPVSVAYDTRSNELIAADSGSNQISIVNMNARSELNVNVGPNPLSVLYDQLNNMIYVANSGSHYQMVTVVNATTDRTVGNISVGFEPDGIAVDPVTGNLYVSSAINGTVSVVSPSNNSVIDTINVGDIPEGIVYDEGINSIAVSVYGSSDVVIINPISENVTSSTFVPFGPAQIADLGNGYLGVSDFVSSNVTILNSATGAIVSTVKVPSGPSGIAFDPKSGQIFVADFAANAITILQPHFISKSAFSSDYYFVIGGVLVSIITGVAIYNRLAKQRKQRQ